METSDALQSKAIGAPGRIRTPDPLIRSQVLYPTELPVPNGQNWRKALLTGGAFLIQYLVKGKQGFGFYCHHYRRYICDHYCSKVFIV